MADDYEVGYRRPPKHSQWPEGHSGNPRGRKPGGGSTPPRRPKHRIFDGKITVQVDGKTMKLTRIEAALLTSFTNGIRGDWKTLRTFIEAHSKHERLRLAFRPEWEPTEPELGPIVFVGVAAQPALEGNYAIVPPRPAVGQKE